MDKPTRPKVFCSFIQKQQSYYIYIYIIGVCVTCSFSLSRSRKEPFYTENYVKFSRFKRHFQSENWDLHIVHCSLRYTYNSAHLRENSVDRDFSYIDFYVKKNYIRVSSKRKSHYIWSLAFFTSKYNLLLYENGIHFYLARKKLAFMEKKNVFDILVFFLGKFVEK